MALRFILGRAGTGKTTAIYEQIRRKLEDEPIGSPLIYLVPEQATFQAEYTLAVMPEMNGTIRAQVLSFGRLSHRLFQEVGGLTKLAVDDLGKQMVLRLLLERHREGLQVFSRSALHPGFVGQLSRMISECKRYGITAEQLEGSDWGTGTLAQKLHDLRLLMSAYDSYLADIYYDADDIFTKAAEKIPASAYLRDAEIWIDGFSGFTKQELVVIGQLMKHARQVTVALCLDPAEQAAPLDELALFYPTKYTCEKLVNMAKEAGVAIEEPLLLHESRRFDDSPWLRQLEKQYFGWGKARMAPEPKRDDEVTLVSAANRSAEVQALALKLLSLARDEGYRWRDMAVLLRDLGTYADEISMVFKEYDIPFFLDRKRSVMHHPLVELIRSSLECIVTRWRYDAVFRSLKTDLFTPLEMTVPSSRAEIDLLENYVLAYGIHGSMWVSDEPWQYHREQTGYEQIDVIRRRYSEPLMQFEQRLKKAAQISAREMTAELYHFLCDLRVPARLEEWQSQAESAGDLEAAGEHAQVWNGLLELFDQVVEVMGEEKLDIHTYARVLESGLESIQLGLVPPVLDQVVIGSMERSRQPDVKALFILGVNDGIIPKRPSEDGILDEAERERLEQAGVELAPGARQQLMAEQFLLYQAMTRPSERLWFSCALADEEGKALLPSPVMERVKETLPGLVLRFFHNEPSGNAELDAFLLSRPKQVFRHLLTMLRQMKKGRPLPVFWWEVYDWFVRESPHAKQESWLLSGLHFSNQVKKLSEPTSHALFGKELRMSVSRLERYQACPFSHFASHGLKLMERQLYKLERFDVGELYHSSLKRAVERMREENWQWSELSESDSMKLASEVVEELVPETRASILNRTARYRYLTGKLKRAVGRAIAVLSEHARRSRFAPVGLEVSFGPGGELPGIAMKLANGVFLRLIGRIDRVDQSTEEGKRYLRVIDYKSSPKTLALSDVWNGLNLQLLVYLDVVISNAKEWLGEEAEIGGVFYYQVADPFIVGKRMMSAKEIAKQRAAKLKMKGLMLADTQLAHLMDTELATGSSDLLPFGLKKDGDFTSHSSVATKEQFQYLQRYVRKAIFDTSTDLTNGVIAIAPYAQGDYLACRTCNYKSVCQFDQALDGNEQRHLLSLKDKQVWSLLEQTIADEGGGTA